MVQFGIELGAPSHPVSRPAAERQYVRRLEKMAVRYLANVILLFAVSASAQSPDAPGSAPWSHSSNPEARCHIFDRDPEPTLAWFSAHPSALDSWIENLQALCFTDHLAKSDLQRKVAHEVYAGTRSQILDRVQPYQQHSEYGAVASRIIHAAHALEIPYR
jgi:hypothetical protein